MLSDVRIYIVYTFKFNEFIMQIILMDFFQEIHLHIIKVSWNYIAECQAVLTSFMVYFFLKSNGTIILLTVPGR